MKHCSSNRASRSAVFRTQEEAPRVLIANSNLVGQWSNYPEFNRLEKLGLTMYGQMTAGSWIYIASQGIVQGTFETFSAAAENAISAARSKAKLLVTGGLGGMGGAQPLAATMAARALPRDRGRPGADREAAAERLLRQDRAFAR